MYLSRLIWDTQRRDCWTTYAALVKEANELVVTGLHRTVALPSTSHDSPNRGVGPISTQSTANGKTCDRQIVNDVNQLCAKFQQFAEVQVPNTGVCLDAAIEQLQVPEDFIDEQDRIDALADELMSQSRFLGELLQQWQKADELHSSICAADTGAKLLLSKVEHAKADLPSAGSAQSFAQSFLELSRLLEGICGLSARDFLAGTDTSSRRLRLANCHTLPAPRHIRWPAQDSVAASLTDALHEELITAAKQARRAKIAVEAYQEITKADSQMQEAADRLLDATQACARLETECSSNRPASSNSSSFSDNVAQILSDVAALTVTSPLPSLSSNVAKIQSRLSIIEGQAASAQIESTELLLKCKSLGFASDAQQWQLNEASSAWSAQYANTKTALTQMLSLVRALQLMETAQEDLSRGEADLQLGIARWAKVAESSRFGLTKSRSDPSTDAPEVSDGNRMFAAAGAAVASLAAFEAHPLALLVPKSTDVLKQRCEHLSTRSVQLQRLATWAKSVSRQAECATLVRGRFDVLHQNAEHIRAKCDQLLSDGPESTDEVDRVQSDCHELRASIAHFTASQNQDMALVGPAPDFSSLSLEGKPIVPPSTDSEVRDVSNTWCLTLAQKHREIEDALAALRNAAADKQSNEQDELRLDSRDEEDEQGDQTADALQQATDKTDALSPASAERLGDDRGSDEVRNLVGPTSPSTKPSTSASLTFPSPCLPLTPERPVKQHVPVVDQNSEQERSSSQAQSTTYAAFATAVRDCEQELSRRERSFTKVLESKASRRLPVRAFISELNNRRNDAEEKLSLRLEVIKSALELLEDTSGPGESPPMLDRAQQEAVQMASAIQGLLTRLDGVILAEGGDAPLPAEQPLHVASELSRSKSSVSSLSADLEGRFRISAGSPDVVRSKSTTSLPPTQDTESLPISAAPIEVPDAGPKIAELVVRLTGGEVETQTIFDGMAQMKAFLDFPTSEQSRHVQDDWEQLRGDVDTLLQHHGAEPAAASLKTLSLQREEQVNRYRLLTVFSEKAAESEAALASFLDLLDQTGNESFEDGLRSVSPPYPQAMRQEAWSTKPPRYTPRSSLADEDYTVASNLSDAQRIRAALAALEPILEQGKQAAAPVSQDARVKERLAQIDRSYVDMAEMASDVLNPGLQRSSSVSSLTSTVSQGSSSASLPPSPVLSMSSRFGFSSASTSSVATAPISKAVQAAARPSVSPAPSASSIPRARKISSASSTSQAPTATALRALRRKSGAHKTMTLDDQDATVSQIPRRRSSASPGPATPRAPTAARTRLTSITGSPATPTVAHVKTASTSDPFGTPTPSRLRAPSAFARPSSMGASTPRTPSVKPPASASRKRPASAATPKLPNRPNNYRANPKSKLDVAVAQTINRLSVPVKIEAVKPSGNAAYEDHSGKYWVGHPDPRLCFCRILRSRTIMVRVGGGWQELTRYVPEMYRVKGTTRS